MLMIDIDNICIYSAYNYHSPDEMSGTGGQMPEEDKIWEYEIDTSVISPDMSAFTKVKETPTLRQSPRLTDYTLAKKAYNGAICFAEGTSNIWIKDAKYESRYPTIWEEEKIMVAAPVLAAIINKKAQIEGGSATIGNITAEAGEKYITVSGKQIETEVAVKEQNGTVYIPLKEFAIHGMKKWYGESFLGLSVIANEKRDIHYPLNSNRPNLYNVGNTTEMMTYLLMDLPNTDKLMEVFNSNRGDSGRKSIVAEKTDFNRIIDLMRTDSVIKEYAELAIKQADALVNTQYTSTDAAGAQASLTTFEAGRAVEDAIKEVYANTETIISPIADGGEGTTEAIISAVNGEIVKTIVSNPLGKKNQATYGYIPETKTAIIEMSAAAGITLIAENERNPMNTTTYGVGEIILDAIAKGCRKFIVGIGGSATNDGGIGMLQALGFKFLDKNGKQVMFGARGLKDIVSIKVDAAVKELAECSFCVACDVKNVLCGEDGCSAIYGPQKGATEEMIREMDSWLEHYARLTKVIVPNSDANMPGSGAAGGMGFALLSYLNAKLMSGIELVMRETGLENYIKNADIVVTGEGRLDGQSYMGKAPIGVAKLAKKYNKPVIAFSGCVTDDAVICNEYGIDAFFPIIRKPCSLEEAMSVDVAYRNLKNTACQVFKLLNIKI